MAALVTCALGLTACGQAVQLAGVEDVPLPAPPETSVVVAADGTLLAELHGGQDRDLVGLERMPTSLRDAVVSVEDARFRAHVGVDPRAIARAFVRNVAEGRVAEGGSTITQQLVKLAYTGDERSLRRKAVEALVAVSLEQRFTKDAILERYLNTVYFGHGAYGVATAARHYFGVEVDALSLPQSALLAALLRSPSDDDPYAHPERALARRNVVLERMLALGVAGPEEVEAARRSPLALAPPQEPARRAPMFVAHVLDVIAAEPALAFLGPDAATRRRHIEEAGLRIETTLDPGWQDAAEDAIAAIAGLPTDPQAVIVALSPTDGRIRAMASRDDDDPLGSAAGTVLATQALRQPGSTFKALVLATALAEDHTLDERFPGGSSVTIRGGHGQGPWRVDNYDGRDPGAVTLATATTQSVNTVFARLIDDVGPEAVARTAQAAGVARDLAPLPSLALGAQEVTPLDMASVASTLAAGGQRRAPQALRRVLGPDGTVLYDAGDPVAQPVLDPRAAWLTTAALRRTVAEGTGRRAELRRPLAGKTGTSQDNADAWFLGYTPDLAAAVWVGFPEGRIAMEPPRTRIRVEGGNWPAELFARFGARALVDVPAHDFPAPPDPLGVTDQQLGVIPELPASGPAGPDRSLPLLGVVPDVTGLSLAEAVARLERVGLAPQVLTGCPAGDARCASRAARPGMVWEQMPASGTIATPGHAVTISAAPGRGRG